MNKMPYIIVSKDNDVFTINVKGTKPYIELEKENKQLKEELKKEQSKILKALEYIEKKWYSLNTTNIDEVFSLGNWKVDLCNLLKGDSNE